MPDQNAPIAAQITHTTNPFLSPIFLGAIVTMLAMGLSMAGVHFLDDQAVQQQVIGFLGIFGTAIAHYFWPHQDGRLSFAAPLSTPAPQNVPTGASVVTVPAAHDQVQVATVTPVDVGAQIVTVSPATTETRRASAEPMTVTVEPDADLRP